MHKLTNKIQLQKLKIIINLCNKKHQIIVIKNLIGFYEESYEPNNRYKFYNFYNVDHITYSLNVKLLTKLRKQNYK
jgi:hypothetical protein